MNNLIFQIGVWNLVFLKRFYFLFQRINSRDGILGLSVCNKWSLFIINALISYYFKILQGSLDVDLFNTERFLKSLKLFEALQALKLESVFPYLRLDFTLDDAFFFHF